MILNIAITINNKQNIKIIFVCDTFNIFLIYNIYK